MNQHLGYQPDFMGVHLDLPKFDHTLCVPLSKNPKTYEIKYTHYSSFQHKERLLPLMAVVNISGAGYNASSRTGDEPWDFSDQIPQEYQLGPNFYSHDKNTFDRGHLVRRVDPCWGKDDIASQAELETFRWTNCTPQHKNLNRKGGIWYELEQHVMENGVKNRVADISVFSGPVLDKKDRAFEVQYAGRDVKIPLVFWKIICWKKSDGKLYAVGFMMSQYEWVKDKLKPVPAHLMEAAMAKLDDDYFEQLKFDDHKTYQVPVDAISKATGISFSWPNVHFPYSKKTFTVVRGENVKPYRLAMLHEAYTHLENEKQGSATHAKAMMLAAKKETLTEEQLHHLAEQRVTGIKRMNLSNITL